MDERDRHKTGMSIRRSVLGEAHVNRAEAAKTSFDEEFQDLDHPLCLGGNLVAPRASPPHSQPSYHRHDGGSQSR